MEQRDPDRTNDDARAHLDAEAIALIAIGEAPSTRGESYHLAVCPTCRSELDQLHEAAEIARTTIGDGALVAPAASVWAGIHRELALAPDVRPPGSAPVGAGAPAVGSRRADRAPRTAAPEAAPVASIAEARERHGRMRRVVAPLVGVAAAAAAIGGLALAWDGLRPAPEPTTLASASLDALPAWQGSTGAAVVTESADGERIVSIELAASAEGEGVREVWLLTPEVDGLISLGLLEGGSGTFVIPDGIDLSEYPIVDVSLEPVDGDPAHSGDSIVRGALDV
ncbi:MAG: anti-sigma factor [Microcella sp.]|uniref:anti-sigma factor n=1 Tax=Microcella sp. TaxID=1913979 RepID=UPI0027197AC6|nr:anti-sigma factor [Microcella sp.]MDO8338992.1 anti-sigma factor [Microcella sp.]